MMNEPPSPVDSMFRGIAVVILVFICVALFRGVQVLDQCRANLENIETDLRQIRDGHRLAP